MFTAVFTGTQISASEFSPFHTLAHYVFKPYLIITYLLAVLTSGCQIGLSYIISTPLVLHALPILLD
jgi:hypothetical protein